MGSPAECGSNERARHSHLFERHLAASLIGQVTHDKRYVPPMKVIAGPQKSVPLPVLVAGADVGFVGHKPFTVLGESNRALQADDTVRRIGGGPEPTASIQRGGRCGDLVGESEPSARITQ